MVKLHTATRGWLKLFLRLPRRALIACVDLYQATLSPDHGPLRHLHPYGYCRHEPTCSAYAKIVIEGKGALVGSLLAARRLLSCHPWKEPSPEKLRALAQKLTSQS